METTTLNETGRMAAWIATGGAAVAMAGEEAGRDDGLMAAGPTQRVYACADDGLEAGQHTTTTWRCLDDGLEAGQPSAARRCYPGDAIEADGLKAGQHTGFGCLLG